MQHNSTWIIQLYEFAQSNKSLTIMLFISKYECFCHTISDCYIKVAIATCDIYYFSLITKPGGATGFSLLAI